MGYRYTIKEIRELRARWQNQQPRIEAIIRDIRSGMDWTKNLLASEEFGWEELPLLNTCPSRHHIPGEATLRDLRGLTLRNLDLSGVEGFANICMDLCILDGIIFDGCSLTGVSLRFAMVHDNCVLDRARLMYADLRSVNCPGVSMKKADLTNADLRGGNFEDCNFEEACLSFVDVTEFTRESIFHFILRILNIYFWWSRFGGDYQSSDQFGPGTDPLLKRYVNRCNQRLDLKRRYRLLAPIMSLIANYGYSPMRVLFWGFVIWFSFGVLYAGISLPASLEDTWVGDALCWLSPKIDWNGQERPRHLADPFYFSLVTMTTLGYGDITPLDWKAKVYAGVEVFLGYVILALFVATVVQRMG